MQTLPSPLLSALFICICIVSCIDAFSTQRRLPAPTLAVAPSSTQLSAGAVYKLWDRLEIEPDEEPSWYLLNCVATLELDLLAQCQKVCADLDPKEHPTKFVVPVERHTRSHGANRIVTETKVKYPGYVFCYLALTAEVYERIQPLDLCRSWMGTIHRKGYRKLPPLPTPLNEMEVEKFGLDDMDETDLETLVPMAQMKTPDADGILLDDGEDDEGEAEAEGYDGVKTNGVDLEALKQYQGLKVDDMIKVTAEGKFLNEDGVVRRLKNGQIFVRFYTYGTMFEEWLNPSDVRKMSGEEILRGLQGPQNPITQRDFDGPEEGGYNDRRDRGGRRENSFQSFGGGNFGNNRNRRQDRIANRFQNDRGPTGEENWRQYQEQRDQYRSDRNRGGGRGSFQQQQGNSRFSDYGGRGGRGQGRENQFRGSSFQDNRQGNNRQNAGYGGNPGSPREVFGNNNRDGRFQSSNRNWNDGNDDFQAGWKSQRQTRRETTRTRNNLENRRTEAAIDGKDDWSAFVSKPAVPVQSEGDDFFSSLITELEKDLGQPGGGQSRPQPIQTNTAKEDDFFASLLSDLEGGDQNAPTTSRTEKAVEVRQDDDFFASLEQEIAAGDDDILSNLGSTSGTKGAEEDDFFSSLGADLEATLASQVVPEEPFRQEEAPVEEESFEGRWSAPKRKSGQSDGSPVTASEPVTPKPQPQAPAASPSMNEGDLSSRTVPMLKDMLRERGLKVGGKKAELIERLLHS